MAQLRKASAYSKKKVTPYTRKSKVRTKSYIKTVPPNKIVKYGMGNQQAFNQGKFPFVLEVTADENVQIRDNALEACRQLVNKQIDKALQGQYFFQIKAHPHQILRENKLLTGAGSDRMQTGMQHAFGKTIGRAAVLKKGKTIFLLALPNQKAMAMGRKAVSLVKAKLPGRTKVKATVPKKVSKLIAE